MAVMEAESKVASRPTCQGRKRDGSQCASTILDKDGMCFAHGAGADKLAQLGRKGGQRSANTKRARRDSQAKALRSAREILRAEFVTDEPFRKAVVAAYKDGLHAQTAKGDPDHSERRQTADALINQIEGKPQQNIQTKTDVTITVVSRLDAALETHADIELPESSVTELEA